MEPWLNEPIISCNPAHITIWNKNRRVHTDKPLPNLNDDPTKSFQSQVRKVINNGKTLIPSESKWKYLNLNPTALSIKGLIKLHKPEHPIRPVVNWRGAPAYKLARQFTQKIKLMAPLPNTHNLENTTDLLKKLENTPILPHFTLASLDISNLYTNILVKETR